MRGPLVGAWWGLLCTLAAAAIDAGGGCEFPKGWTGRWFQSGVPTLIAINTSAIETKGECVESDGDKFITEDKADNCFRCVVIHEKHPNVLQYKETYCDSRLSLGTLCDQITGDATLYSMFRADSGATPTPCPFHGPPFTFTYSRGAGECRSPVSRLDSCSDEAHLLLRYQACPDVAGTESTVEELVCLAVWKEGNTRYLVGKLYHKTATTDEDRYRCFVYDRGLHDGRVTYDVAQSGDATCSGLLSPTEGSRTMRLTKVENHHATCRFPTWVTDHHNWYTLDMKRYYHFSHRNATLRIINDASQEVRIICHAMEKADTNHQATIVAHITSGCNSGYVCMVFYRREGHVIELQQTNQVVQVPEEACSSAYVRQSSLPYITLITVSLHPRKCPYLGRYSISSSIGTGRKRRQDGSAIGVETTDCGEQEYESLDVGCSNTDTMHFYSSCSEAEHRAEFSCHGSWEDNGTNYLIVSPASRKSVGARRYCFIYTQALNNGVPDGSALGADNLKKRRDTKLLVSYVTDSCHRNIVPGVTGERAFNLTKNGQCAQASTGAASTTAIVLPSIFFILTLAAAISNMR